MRTLLVVQGCILQRKEIKMLYIVKKSFFYALSMSTNSKKDKEKNLFFWRIDLFSWHLRKRAIELWTNRQLSVLTINLVNKKMARRVL